MSDADDARRRIAAVWRLEAATVIGCAARIVRDIGLAEDLAQDALVTALEVWPRDGIPDNPGAWLLTVTRRRALDHFRHTRMAASKASEVGVALDFQHQSADDAEREAADAALDDDVGDQQLRLIFTACHPILSPEARSALTLRVMGGLTTAEIARAYLKPEPTIAQRIVRAKRSLAAAGVPFELPHGCELRQRLASVLEVIYLMFNEGYVATAGDDWMRPALCAEALRLGRVLAGLMPDESEVFGLVALMEIQASRIAARVSASGEPVLLLDQDRRRWDHLLIRRGLEALARSEALPANALLGPYALQAAIAACHARATQVEQTDWRRIVALYDALDQIAPSPVVRLNRAVAVSMADGPAAALDLVDELRAEPALHNYHWLPSVRGELLGRLQRPQEARVEFERAAALAHNGRERALLLARAANCQIANAPSPNHFDHRAATWDADPVKRARALAVATGIRNQVPISPQMRALEYGCGTGLLSFALQAQLAHLALADSSQGMLSVLDEKITVQRIGNMHPMRLDLLTDPLPPQRYDLIYTLMTFHHVRDTDALLRCLYRLLASPGYLCVADLDSEDGSFHGQGFDGHKGFDRGVLATKAEAAGFREPAFTTVFTMTRGDGSTPTEYPIFLMVARK